VLRTSKHDDCSALLCLVLAVAICAAQWRFLLGFLPGANGNLGDDYTYFLPLLLDGKVWALRNGHFAVEWFTPAFGCGLPRFANPQGMQFSLLQLLSFWMSPLSALRLGFLILGVISFLAVFRYLRTLRGLSRNASLFGATVWIFNGFWLYRMIIGHLTYHTLAYLPLMIVLMVRASRTGGAWRLFLAGVLGALMVLGGGANMLPAYAGVSLMALGAEHFVFNEASLKRALVSFGVSWGICIALSLAFLNAASEYLAHFPRDFYGVAQFHDLSDALRLTLKWFFWLPGANEGSDLYVKGFSLGQHELEFSVGPAAGLVIATGCALTALGRLRRWWPQRRTERSSAKRRARVSASAIASAVLVGAFMASLVLNTKIAFMDRLIKSVPGLASVSTFLRWQAVWLLVLSVVAALALERILRIPWFERERRGQQTGLGLTLLFTCATVAFPYLRDNNAYQSLRYSPDRIAAGNEALTSGGWQPRISTVVAVFRNDLFVDGATSLTPYEPIFGYHLETFPAKGLTVGSPFLETPAGFNFARPECDVFPNENGCRPGDQFAIGEAEKLNDFLEWHGPPFRKSLRQRVAEAVTMLAWIVVLGHFVFASGRSLRRKWPAAADTGH
jgi:hypothetical protein